jgi:hypothetical protein
MGLYLCVFSSGSTDHDDVEELAASEIGHYSDFGFFRDTIARQVGRAKYPVLMEHSDCDGEWTVEELPRLRAELQEISAAFRRLPPTEPVGAFEHTAQYRKGATSLYDCFHDVNGTNLFEALSDLCEVGLDNGRPITFT